MTAAGITLGTALIVFVISLIVRFYYSVKEEGELADIECSRMVLKGDREIQNTAAGSDRTGAGMAAVAADGIGRKGTGRACAILAVQIMLEQFAHCQASENISYFIQKAFREADRGIKKFLDDLKTGGASIGFGIIKEDLFYYAAAGDVEIWLFRNGDLIPLTKGQTLDVLAEDSYRRGRITRQAALMAMEEKRIYNFAGQETFHPIELCQTPIRLQERDILLFFTKGIHSAITEQEVKNCLQSKNTAAVQKTAALSQAFAKSRVTDKENGSMVLLQINRMEGQG